MISLCYRNMKPISSSIRISETVQRRKHQIAATTHKRRQKRKKRRPKQTKKTKGQKGKGRRTTGERSQQAKTDRGQKNVERRHYRENKTHRGDLNKTQIENPAKERKEDGGGCVQRTVHAIRKSWITLIRTNSWLDCSGKNNTWTTWGLGPKHTDPINT